MPVLKAALCYYDNYHLDIRYKSSNLSHCLGFFTLTGALNSHTHFWVRFSIWQATCWNIFWDYMKYIRESWYPINPESSDPWTLFISTCLVLQFLSAIFCSFQSTSIAYFLLNFPQILFFATVNGIFKNSIL